MLESFARNAERQRPGVTSGRDESMYRNLVWYLERLPAHSRVVVWTATVHAARQRGSFSEMPLGARVVERWGGRVGAVGFTAYAGYTSRAGRPASPIADAYGSVDKKKRSALYVHIGKTGEVGLHPNQITADESAAAIQLAKRFAEGLWQPAEEYRKLLEILPVIFGSLADGHEEKQAGRVDLSARVSRVEKCTGAFLPHKMANPLKRSRAM